MSKWCCCNGRCLEWDEEINDYVDVPTIYCIKCDASKVRGWRYYLYNCGYSIIFILKVRVRDIGMNIASRWTKIKKCT